MNSLFAQQFYINLKFFSTQFIRKQYISSFSIYSHIYQQIQYKTILINQLSQMNFIKSFFSSTPQQQARSYVDKYLSSIQIFTKQQALNLTFQYQLNNSISQCSSPTLYMQQLGNKLLTTKNVSATVKLFTVIHNAIYERDYQKDQLQGLQELPLPFLQNEQQQTWFHQFAVNYCNYLRKLPSVCDVYQRAKISKPRQSQKQMIINQIGLLFPSICTFTNTIGRYYLTSYPQFPQFYRMLNKQITMVYTYLKLIIDEILLAYRRFDVNQLKCFMKTIPQIELTCDKMQDLLLSKYFKGKTIKSKIYFKQQKVQEVCYYLDYQLQGRKIEQNDGQTLSTENGKQKKEQIRN